MQGDGSRASGARIVLAGHRDTVARVDVSEVPLRRRVVRTLVLAAFWGTVTAAVFFITVFDPFMTSMPVLVGAVTVWRSWKGEWRVRSFCGGCPRCGAELLVKPKARIGVPHPLVCYSCHHEPQLVLRAA
jgi:hypothetical protein